MTQITFGDITVDPQSNTISRGDQAVRLEPLVMSLFCVLIEHRGAVVSRQQLNNAVWGDRDGGDESLTRAASRLRQGLKELDAGDWLETVPKRGYMIKEPKDEDREARSSTGAIIETAENPNQTARRPAWASLAAAAIIVCIGLFLFVALPALRQSQDAPVAAPDALAATSDAVVLAVLPFTVDENTTAHRHLAEGISAAIYSKVNSRENTQLLGRQTSKMLSKADDFSEMARRFNVTHVLDGVLLVEDGRLRVDAAITRLSDGVTVWASRFDRNIDDVFDIQDELALAIGGVLHIKPNEHASAGGVRSVRAYELVLQAKAMKKNFELFGDTGAVKLLEQAVALEPDWTQARAEYASALQYAAILRQGDEFLFEEFSAKAREQAQKVLAVESDNITALSAMVILEAMDWNWVEGRAIVDRMLTIAPNDPTALFTAATFFSLTGELTRATQMYEAAIAVDPGDPELHTQLAYVSMQLGDHEKTIEHGKLAFAYGALPSQGAHHAIRSLAETGRSDEALALLKEMEESEAGIGYYDEMDARLTKAVVADFESVAARQNLVDYIQTHNRPFIYALRSIDRADLASEILLRRLEIREFDKSVWSMRNLFVPGLGDFHEDNLFRNFVRRSGLLEYWKTYSWPDVCRKNAEREFVCG